MIKVSESIDQLLKSTSIDDVVIGLVMCYKQYGKSGMRELFQWKEPVSYKYRTRCDKKQEFIRFKDFEIYIGPVGIEFQIIDKTSKFYTTWDRYYYIHK